MKAPARWKAQPGHVDRKAATAGTLTIARHRASRHSGGTAYRVTPSEGEAFRIVVSGRVQWALDRLREAGPTGCTTLKQPAPRLSAYVFSLREMGIEIETITEPHDGDFPGHHGQYVLHSTVTRWAEGGTV